MTAAPSPASSASQRFADASPSFGDERYRVLFEANPLPMWVYDLETLRILDVNEVACRKYGYARDEFLSLTIRDIRPPEDVPFVEDSVRNTPPDVFNSGVWRHQLKDGTLIHVEITSHEMNYMGRLTRFVCPIDVTQRLRAEAALRERAAGLQRAQAMARLGHVITRPDGSFESWSQTLPSLAGVPPERMPATTRDWMQQLIVEDDRAKFRAASIDAAVRGERVDVEYRLRRADGSVAHVCQVIEPIVGQDDGGDGGGRWFSTLQDVTDQKLAQARMLRINEELEQRVRERTAQLEITNQELTRATAAAQRANDAKSEFISSMSHELRTPLNAIIGFGQLLTTERMPASAEQRARFVEHIVKAGQHLLTLINEILDLSQIEAGKLTVITARVVVAEVLAECEAMIEPLAEQHRVRVTFPAGVELAVAADRTRLKQVLLNLLSNAVKYNRERGAVIVDCRRTETGRIRIAVQDTGMGLKPEQIEALFQPFNRLGQEGGALEGSGIGLVVTRRLVELMGGEIGVSSTPGIGSVFWIDLPADGAAHAEADRPAAASGDAGEALVSGGDADVQACDITGADPAAQTVTVLCVEDNPASLRLVQAVLAERSDIRLLCAVNGKLGVEMARTHKPAVILMDNNMPEMSGREAQAILRSDPRTARIPIIALTANAMPGAASDAAAAGFFRYLSKPFDVAALLVALDEALVEAGKQP
jgi:PAS domain S-box-containing protein